MRDGEYPNRVPHEEMPEATPENVPDDVIKEALKCLQYVECPECETRQWKRYVSGRNSSGKCVECDTVLKLIG